MNGLVSVLNEQPTRRSLNTILNGVTADTERGGVRRASRRMSIPCESFGWPLNLAAAGFANGARFAGPTRCSNSTQFLTFAACITYDETKTYGDMAAVRMPIHYTVKSNSESFGWCRHGIDNKCSA